MAPKGLEYEGSDFGFFDDDNDVLEEIKILSDQQDLIFHHSKDSWYPLYPALVPLADNSEKTVKSKIGLRKKNTNA